MRRPRQPSARTVSLGLVAIVATAMTIWLLLRPATTPTDGQALTAPAHQHESAPTTATSSPEAGPPWRYGRPGARYTIIEYADLECPFCRSYFPILKRWIDAHPEANWQWHHLPLAIHEPAATAGARLVECVGAVGGQAAFWQALEWAYANTRSNGQGLPEGLAYPDITPAAKQCLASDRPDALIHAQAEEAAQNGVSATPALRLRDRETGKSLLLHGPVEGDALLSAIDLLSAGGPEASESSSSPDMPAAPVGDMPR